MNAKILFFCLPFLLMDCDPSDDFAPKPDPALVYFLVKEIEYEHGDSYILPLKDPAQIAEARALIANKENKIIVAEITRDKKDNYSLNKDLLNSRVWSWHISEFLSFADFSIEILDGWPIYVEENYTDWVNNTKGSNGKPRIGFWNYRVDREVSYEELYTRN